TDVGEVEAIYQYGPVDVVLFVVTVYFRRTGFQIFFYQANVGEALNIVGRQVPDAGYFDVQRPLYPPATYFLHTAPVLERVGYKRIGRNCSDRLIPVAHFYGSQVYFYHIA